VVEDHPLVQQVLCALLGRVGYSVTVAASADVALAALGNEPLPDLIILDLGLPGIRGHPIWGRLQRDPQMAAIPVVATSAAWEAAHDAPDLPVAAYVWKPLCVRTLLKAVAQAGPSGPSAIPAARPADSVPANN
jgi:CheY-like chemotaxis protein